MWGFQTRSCGKAGAWLLAIGVSWGASLVAWADVDERLDRVQSDVERLVRDAERLQQQLLPGQGFIPEPEARRRFEDHLYQYMVGKHGRAAEGFFVLVTTASLESAGLHQDAEWYLADALYELGNYGTAEARFKVLADQRDHPFRDDAVRRLLELYVHLGRSEQFYETHQREVAQGRVEPSDLIIYTVGKAMFQQGDTSGARRELGALTEESPYYARARYVLGAVAVVERALDEALVLFDEVQELTAGDPEQRDLHELAWMAEGRIHHELGELDRALESYQQVPADSEFLADRLQEQVAAFIRQGDYGRALQGVEVFLIGFPDHPVAPQLNLMRGHLSLRLRQHHAALAAYEDVIAEYTTVGRHFGELARSTEEPATFFQRLLEMGESDWDPDLPEYALTMMQDDPDLSRAIDVHRDLAVQDRQLEESEHLVQELEELLERASTMQSFDRMRYDVRLLRNSSMQARVDLLLLEEQWLQNQVGSNGELDELGRRLRSVQAQLLQTDVGDTDETSGEGTEVEPAPVPSRLMADVDHLRSGIRQLRRSQGKGGRVGARLDGLHETLTQVEGVLAQVQEDMGDAEVTELERIRERFRFEAEAVGRQRADHQRALAEAEQVSLALTQKGFARLEGFFAEAVEGADVGIVNVYWDQLREAGEGREHTAQRMQQALRDFERRADVLRQKTR